MACLSEGEDVVIPTRLFDGDADDVGIAARLAKRLINWSSTTAGKLEVIRPGTFTAQFIRSTGLKTPVLIKGDRFNENPQMGLIWPDVHSISVDILSDYIGSERKVDTWDVVKQRPGPAWTLSQWCTYWHARQDAATRMGKPQTAQPAQAGFGGFDDEDDDEGEVVDSGVVIVLQGAGHRHHNPYTAARASGISPEQAQRLLDGECLPLHGSNLTQHIHPPPAIHSVDLVRPVEREVGRMPGFPGSVERDAAAAAAAARGDGEGEVRRGPALEIKPADTLHLQMTPKDCFTDFRLAPGGAATWLYVLLGSKVVVLFPPTAKNRRLYLTWCMATRANQAKENMVVECFLADYAEGAVKVEVKASQGLAIPSSWFYATATPQDCIAVGCFFWHAYALGDIARAQQTELDLKLRPARFMLPARQLLWYAGAYYARQLRERLGILPPFHLRRPAGAAGGARRSTSEASLNQQQQQQQQQQRRSPYLAGLPGAAAAAVLLRGTSSTGGQQQQQFGRQGGTPPMLALQQCEGSSGAVLGSPMMRCGKRGRPEIDALCLGEAAVSLGPAAAGAGAPKRLKISTVGKQPGTPHASSAAAAAGTAGMFGQQQQLGSLPSHSGLSTPRSVNRGGGQVGLGAAGNAAAMPSTSNHSDAHMQQQQGGAAAGMLRRQQQYAHVNSPRQRQQQRNSYAAAAAGRARHVNSGINNDDDDEGECHTSPVRRPEPGPMVEDDQAHHPAAGFVPGGEVQYDAGHQQQQRQQGQRAAAASADANSSAQKTLAGVSTLKIKVPGRLVPMYSPVIQPMHGDLDSIPALTGQQSQAVGTPPPAAAALLASRQVGVAKGLSPAVAAAQGAVPAAAAAATPGKLKITLKGQGTPTAAAAAAAAALTPRGRADAAAAMAFTAAGQEGSGEQQRRKSPDSSSAGSHAVSTALTNTSSDKPPSQQQQQLEERRQQQAAAAAVGEMPPKPAQQQQQQQMPPVQRRPFDGTPRAPAGVTPVAAAAAGGGGGTAKPGLKLKFKMASPSPKLGAMVAPHTGVGVPPALSLDAPAAAAAAADTQQQQQQRPVIPQVDGAYDTLNAQAACSSTDTLQQPLQQQQQHIAAKLPRAGDAVMVQELGAIANGSSTVSNACAAMQVDLSSSYVEDVVLQGQYAMRHLLHKQQRQQLASCQAVLWTEWHCRQTALRPQQQQQPGCQMLMQRQQQWRQHHHVLQVDGTADDSRQAKSSGPMLVMQPAPAATGSAAVGRGSPQQQQQQVMHGGNSSSIGDSKSPRGAAQQPHDASLAAAEAAEQKVAEIAAVPIGRAGADTPNTAISHPVGSPVGFLSPGRTNAANRLAGATAAALGGSSGGAPGTGAVLPAASDVLLPLHRMPHSSARPPMAKQQQAGSTAAAAAAADTRAVDHQGGVVTDANFVGHAIVKPNPVLQPQVQKLKLAAAAAAAAATAAATAAAAEAGSPGSSSPQPAASPTAAAAAMPCADEQQEPLEQVQSLRDVFPAVPSFTCWAGQDVEAAAAAATAAAAAAAATPVAQERPSAAATDVVAATAGAAQQPMDGAAAADWAGLSSRAGSNCLASPVPAAVAAAAAAPAPAAQAAATAGAAGVGGMSALPAAPVVIVRRPSGVGDSMDPVITTPAAATGLPTPPTQQQQPAAMLPPPPTRLSAWEIAEVPVLLAFLHEQYTEKADLPDYIQDPEWVLQQFHEAVSAMGARDIEDAPHRAAAAAALVSNQQQQQPALALRDPAAPAAGAMVMAAAEAAAAATAAAATSWNSSCGPLVLSAFAPDEMPAGFAEHCKAAQALLRSSGIFTAATAHEETTEVVGETGFFEQTNSAGTGSWDNRSVGSIGGSRGGAAAAAVTGVAGAGRGGGMGHSKGQVKRAASQLQGAATAGAAQAKKANQNKVLKGIGLSTKKR